MTPVPALGKGPARRGDGYVARAPLQLASMNRARRRAKNHEEPIRSNPYPICENEGRCGACFLMRERNSAESPTTCPLRTRTSRLGGGARPPHPPENLEVWRRGGESCELERHQPTLTEMANRPGDAGLQRCRDGRLHR